MTAPLSEADLDALHEAATVWWYGIESIGTHWDGCEKYHNECLIAKQDAAITQLREQRDVAIRERNRAKHLAAASRCTKFDAVPPADVIAVGCGDWEFDGVPF
jgi:hypothetical protein